MTEHTILVAFTVEGADRASAEADLRYALRGALEHPPVESWWVAEDDRHDGSDNDSAVFVRPGEQREASLRLHEWGLTDDCNVLPPVWLRSPDMDTSSNASRQHRIDTGLYLHTGEDESPSPFEVVGSATYDAATDTVTPDRWYIVVDRDEPFEPVVIGPFDTEPEAREHMDFSADVEDWCYGEAKAKGYVVDDVYLTQTPTIPSYGVNAPVHPEYAEGTALGILPGTEA